MRFSLLFSMNHYSFWKIFFNKYQPTKNEEMRLRELLCDHIGGCLETTALCPEEEQSRV